MANLPEVVLKEIFDFLTIREMWRVRSTCKKWKFVVDTWCRPRSVCIHSTSYPYNERWCFSDQRVVEDEMIYLKFHLKTNRLFDLRMEFFRNLQKVYLYHLMEKVDLFFEEASQLTRLKVLMIEERCFPPRTLSSFSLEKLSLKVFNLGRFQLNTPNLSSLILWDITCMLPRDPPVLEFSFPLKVKHLECTDFTHNLGSQLKNLETLVCIEILFDFQLNEFKSLTRAELWSFAAFRTVENQKRRLNRMNLQVLASGFDAETVAGEPLEIQEKFFCSPITIEKGKLAMSSSFLEMAERNRWNLAGSIACTFDLDNLEPESLISFASKIPRAFFDKLRMGRIFFSSNEIDQSALVELAGRCSPSYYSASRCRLSRSEVEKLSRIQSIKRFHGSCDIESADYLLNLKNLEDLQINSPKISIDFICKLFKELKFLYALYFESPESTSLHLYIDFYNYRTEHREADGIAADTLYSLNYYYGPFSLTRDTRVKKGMDFRVLDELIEGVKRLREDEIVQSFFV